MKLLAEKEIILYESPEPRTCFCGSPSIVVLPGGELAASFNHMGPGTLERDKLTEVCFSSDGGEAWEYRSSLAMKMARVVPAGETLYCLGQTGKEPPERCGKPPQLLGHLVIARSEDRGHTWSEPVCLSEGSWHQAPSAWWVRGGNLYIVMEKVVYDDVEGWNVNGLAPILMRGKLDSDLTRRENWTFAEAPAFRDVVSEEELQYIGLPFYHTDGNRYTDVGGGRGCARMGWLETNVVQILDKKHFWYDPQGKTFHLFLRAHTGMTNYACIMKVTEAEDGSMKTVCEMSPGGKKLVFLPLPGGHLKFHILYDEQTALYWLLSSQSTDSMTRPELLDESRYSLPDNERHRLTLHFSKNCVDWCFAGVVAMTSDCRQARSYASMAIDGEDLVVLSRSGNEFAMSSHNGNQILFHRVPRFRELVY